MRIPSLELTWRIYLKGNDEATYKKINPENLSEDFSVKIK